MGGDVTLDGPGSLVTDALPGCDPPADRRGPDANGRHPHAAVEDGGRLSGADRLRQAARAGLGGQVVEAFPSHRHDLGEARDPRRLPPGAEAGQGVGPEDQYQAVVGVGRGQGGERVDRVARAASVELDRRD